MDHMDVSPENGTFWCTQAELQRRARVEAETKLAAVEGELKLYREEFEARQSFVAEHDAALAALREFRKQSGGEG